MTQRNVNLPEEMDRFILAQVDSGQFSNASEVVRAALRSLKREQDAHSAKVEALRNALEVGANSGISTQTLESVWKESEQRHLAQNG